MKSSVVPVLALLSLVAFPSSGEEVLGTAKAVMSAIYERRSATFDLKATAVEPNLYLFEDETGNALFMPTFNGPNKLRPGELCHIVGVISLTRDNPFYTAYAHSIRVIGHRQPTPPAHISGEDFISGKYDLRPVVLQGRIDEVIPDEIDEHNLFVILDTGSIRIPMNVRQNARSRDAWRDLIGHTVTASGIGIPRPSTSRRQIGRTLSNVRLSEISDDKIDPFAAPPLSALRTTQPEILSRSGRHRVSGTVIVKWRHGCALLQTDSGELIRLEGDSIGDIPTNERITAVGFPETDLYTLILTRAVFRRDAGGCPNVCDDEPIDLPLAKLLVDTMGSPRINSRYHGRPIRVSGTVVSCPSADNPNKRIIIRQDGFTLPIDVSMLPALPKGLSIGVDVSATAIAVLETEKWRPNSIFPKINELITIVRNPKDIIIVRTPSWWTTGRLLTILALLAAVILVFTVWNILLRRLAERRGRELAQSEITRAESDLKTSERTRLAIELHDALSQNLTAVSMEIETAQQFLDGATQELKSHLGIAEKALDSCRSDLRNCLWDLRNEALETATMNDAVRMTLLPHVRNVGLAIRFNVKRDALTDSTAHTILCIIRELTVNAIRHGHASHVAVAGTIENGQLLFSVQDNGSGFDAEHAPGIAQGHFGLQGVRERVRALDGSFEITSSSESGTKAVIRINLPNLPESA